MGDRRKTLELIIDEQVNESKGQVAQLDVNAVNANAEKKIEHAIKVEDLPPLLIYRVIKEYT